MANWFKIGDTVELVPTARKSLDGFVPHTGEHDDTLVHGVGIVQHIAPDFLGSGEPAYRIAWSGMPTDDRLFRAMLLQPALPPPPPEPIIFRPQTGPTP